MFKIKLRASQDHFLVGPRVLLQEALNGLFEVDVGIHDIGLDRFEGDWVQLAILLELSDVGLLGVGVSMLVANRIVHDHLPRARVTLLIVHTNDRGTFSLKLNFFSIRPAMFSLRASFSSSLMPLSLSTIFLLLFDLLLSSFSKLFCDQQITQQLKSTVSSSHDRFPARISLRILISLGQGTISKLNLLSPTFLQLLNGHLYL